jgi:hypothetical protein
MKTFWYAVPYGPTDTDPQAPSATSDDVRAAFADARDKALEESAKVCDGINHQYTSSGGHAAERCAAAIRALRTTSGNATAAVLADRTAGEREVERLQHEVDHFAALACDDLGKNPPVWWKERAEAAERQLAEAVETLDAVAQLLQQRHS